MSRLIRLPLLWLAAFAAWFGVLWWLSSQPNPFPSDLPFQVNDKLQHVGYFLIGGALFSGFLFRLDPDPSKWRKPMVLAIVVVGLVGALDEWHQSHVDGRSGNDPGDLAADLIGAFCGALMFRLTHRLVA